MVTASFSPVCHGICAECARDFDRVKKTVAFVAAHNVLFRICVFFFRISSSAVRIIAKNNLLCGQNENQEIEGPFLFPGGRCAGPVGR